MRVFTVIGPAHSGKSTLVAALAQLDGRSTRFEVSPTSAVTQFEYLGEDWAAFDIAGGTDALADAGPAIAASDAVVLCVPPSEDGAVLVSPYLRLVEEAGVPCFLFINRMDAATDRIRDVVAALQTYSGHHIVLRQIPMRKDGVITGAVDLISERAWAYREGAPSDLIELPSEIRPREEEARGELLESLSDFDDALLEQLIEDKRPAAGEVFPLTARVAEGCDLISAFLGSASHNNGVVRLMKSLRHEAPSADIARQRLGNDPVAVVAFGDMRKHMGKLLVLRALDGGVAAGAEIGGAGIGSLNQLDGKTPAKSLPSGGVAIAVKSDHLNVGDVCDAGATRDLPAWASARPPAQSVLVAPVNDRDDARLSAAMQKLPQVDHGASVSQDPTTGKIILGVQGPLHLRRILGKLAEEIGIDVDVQGVTPAFRETISKPASVHHRHRKQSGGAGQFADVQIDILPQARGAGFTFEETVKGGAVPRNYIPAVEAGAEDELAQGPHGFPVVDVKIVLRDGKHHAVDSSDFAFRTAGSAAVREALAMANPVLLQPILRVDIHVPSIFAGGLVPVMTGLGGQVLGFEGDPGAAGWDIFSANLPGRMIDELAHALAGAARGTAWMVTSFDRYEELHGVDAADLSKAAKAEVA